MILAYYSKDLLTIAKKSNDLKNFNLSYQEIDLYLMIF
jgi:hypothetical protein